MGKKSTKRSNGVIRMAVRALRHGLPSRSRDVKKGHFPVVAVDVEEEPKRFVVSLTLTCLSHPVFLSLLDRAEEEFGFVQDGLISLPCRPSEFERIISDL